MSSGPPLPFEVDLDKILTLPADQREEELAKVEMFRRVLEANPLWRYRPHGGELEWKHREREKILQHPLMSGDERRARLATLRIVGDEARGQVEYHELNQRGVFAGAHVAGNRGGKTEGGVADCVIQTLPVEMVPPWLLPYKRLDPARREVRIRIVGPDLKQWLGRVMIPKCRKLIPPAALYKGEFDKAYSADNRLLRFADGSWWDFLTHDMDTDAFAGADLDRIYWDEEPPGQHGKEIHEESVGRIIDREGDFRYTLTPLLGLSWLYYELTGADGEPRQDEETWVVRGDMDHNPFLTEKGKRLAIRRWEKDPLKLEARKKGRWLHFEGLVYPEFRPSAQKDSHVVMDRDIPRAHDDAKPAVPVYESIDPGIADDHAMAYVAAWVNPDDTVEVFHTYRMWGATVEEMAAHIHETRTALHFKARWTKLDPAGWNRNPADGKSIQDAFRRAGIHCEKGNNQREAGINEIKQRLRARTIVFHAGCEDLIDPVHGEFVKHRWKKPRHTRTEDVPKPDVIKRDDDTLDALRYLLMGLPRSPSVDRDAHDAPEGATAIMLEHVRKLARRRARQKRRVGSVN